MWPFSYCGGSAMSCVHWFANLSLFQQVGGVVLFFIVMFIAFRIIHKIMVYVGLMDV